MQWLAANGLKQGGEDIDRLGEGLDSVPLSNPRFADDQRDVLALVEIAALAEAVVVAEHWEFDFRDVAGQRAERWFGRRSTQLSLAVIRTTHWKYVHFASLPALLFDLQADPANLRNLAGDPAYAAVQIEMAERLLGWRAEHLDQTLALQELTANGVVSVSR